MGGKTIEVRVARGVAALAAALVVAVLAAASPAWAANFNVTRLDDPAPGGCAANDCSLREAIRAANVAVGADTINLPAGTHELSAVGTSEDAAATGDLDINDELTINGAGTRGTIVDANQTDRVFHVFAPAVMRNITITGGELDSNGAGAKLEENLTLDRVAIRGNEVVSGDGGALDTDDSPTLRILRSTINDNTAENDAGAIEADGGEFIITNTTISGNEAGTNDGGAIDNDTNVLDGDTIKILNSTIVDNTAAVNGGAISDGENITVKNTIIANNTDGVAGTATDNCAKTGPNDYTSLGHNLENLNSCDFDAPTDQPDTAPGIAALANNGGPTNTHALAKNSAAVDAASNAAAPATDQRGLIRPQDGDGNTSKISDIGAFERAAAPNPRGCTIVGTPGKDILPGTPGRDVICALGGNDVIRGFGGNDTIYGDAGNDTILGGDGNDAILGGPGGGLMFGQAGNDLILGGEGADRLRGGEGNDRLRGGEGNDRLRGGAGADNLFGQAGNDILLGGVGGDFLAGQTGVDRLFGEAGNDTLNVRDNRPGDLANGGPGTDRCAADPGDRRVSCEG